MVHLGTEKSFSFPDTHPESSNQRAGNHSIPEHNVGMKAHKYQSTFQKESLPVLLKIRHSEYQSWGKSDSLRALLTELFPLFLKFVHSNI